jgi:glycosyltransferase involved in cell wall biosynthesis
VRNEFTGALVALLLRRRFGIRFAFQLSAPLVEMNLWVPREASALRRWPLRLTTAIKRFAQQKILARADLIFAISDRMRADLIAKGLRADRIAVLPLGADTDVRPEAYDRTRSRTSLGIRDVPTLIYFGAMDRLRRLDFLLDVMLRVRASVNDVQLLMVGSAASPADEEWLVAESDRRGLGSAVRFEGAVSRASVAEYLAAADVSVAPIPPLPIYTLSSPTKVVESLAMARPVVVNREIADQDTIITESGGGRSVPYDVNAFADAVIELLTDRRVAEESGRRGYEYILKKRSYAQLASDVDAQYRRVLEREEE